MEIVFHFRRIPVEKSQLGFPLEVPIMQHYVCGFDLVSTAAPALSSGSLGISLVNWVLHGHFQACFSEVATVTVNLEVFEIVNNLANSIFYEFHADKHRIQNSYADTMTDRQMSEPLVVMPWWRSMLPQAGNSLSGKSRQGTSINVVRFQGRQGGVQNDSRR